MLIRNIIIKWYLLYQDHIVLQEYSLSDVHSSCRVRVNILCPGQHFQNPTLMIDVFLKIYLNFVHDGAKTERPNETASENFYGTKKNLRI